jgi:hypothetical protein
VRAVSHDFGMIHKLVLRREPKRPREQTKVLRMEFKTFVNALVRIPCQFVRTGRKLIYRVLTGNPRQHMFFCTFAQLHC